MMRIHRVTFALTVVAYLALGVFLGIIVAALCLGYQGRLDAAEALGGPVNIAYFSFAALAAALMVWRLIRSVIVHRAAVRQYHANTTTKG